MINRAYIDAIPVDLLSGQEIFHQVTQWLASTDKSRQIITLNASILITALTNPPLKRVISRADLVIADGYGIIAALKRQKVRIPERITGVELVRSLITWQGIRHYSLYCYGGTSKIAQKMNELFQTSSIKPSQLTLRDGFGVEKSRDRVREEIIEKQPDLLLVGLGSPQQELFTAEVLPFLPKTIGIGIGGSFEVIAGVKKESPYLLRNHGLEWLWRIIQDHKKIKRLPDLVKFWFHYLR